MLLRRLQTLVDHDARALVWIKTPCECQFDTTATARGAIRCRHQGVWVQVPAVPRRLRSQRIRSWLKRLTCKPRIATRPMAERVSQHALKPAVIRT